MVRGQHKEETDMNYNLTDSFNAPREPAPPKVFETYRSYLPVPDRLLIRYDIHVTNYDDDGVVARVYRITFPVIGETKASWFFDEYGKRRHVLKGYGRRYCYDTDEKALHSLRKRTAWRQSHALWAVTKAHAALDAFNKAFPSDTPIPKVKSND